MRQLPSGFAIGHAADEALNTGVTVVLPAREVTAGVHVMGGAPGTRETDLLNPSQAVSTIDALAFAGGSAFGLDAASGVQAWLRERGRGFPAEPFRIPIVPAAIIFDLRAGRMHDWPLYPPYRELAYAACDAAEAAPALGAVGAGLGATTATGRGGVGLASEVLDDGSTVCALAVCNAAGSAYVADTAHFWAAPFEHDGEFGGLGVAHPWPGDATTVRTKAGYAKENTTLVAVLTDATLDGAAAERISVMAHDGFARALYPVHTPADGDVVFTLASNQRAEPADLRTIGVAAANCTARAIAVAVYEGNR